MNSIIALTEQIPYLCESGKIIAFGGGVPRATVNLFNCISDDYKIYVMYVPQGNPNSGTIFRYENMKYITEMKFSKFEEVYEKYFNGISFIFMVDLFIHGGSPYQWKSLPYKKIGMVQTWNTDPLDIGLNGIICNGMEDKTNMSPLLLPIGCLYDSNVFYPTNQPRENFALYTGRLDADKNVQYLMNVWPKIYEKFGTKLKLVGPCNVFKIKIPSCDYITNLPPTNDADLLKYYNTCRCFILPSKCESFCCSLIEALACNAPCVIDGIFGAVKNFNGMAKYVYGNGYVCQNLLQKNIENVLELQDISVSSSKFVENLFSISSNKEKIRSFIRLCQYHPQC